MKLLDPLLPEEALADHELDVRLASLLDAGFEEVAGCIVLPGYADSARRTSIALVRDETGLEAFVNRVHIEDVLRSTTASQALPQAALFARRLARHLTSAYPNEGLEIVLTVSDSCSVRFHKSRSSQNWLADDLESYDEAILRLSASRPR